MKVADQNHVIKWHVNLCFYGLENNVLAAHAVAPDVCADMVVDGGWQSQVEESVGVGSPGQR